MGCRPPTMTIGPAGDDKVHDSAKPVVQWVTAQRKARSAWHHCSMPGCGNVGWCTTCVRVTFRESKRHNPPHMQLTHGRTSLADAGAAVVLGRQAGRVRQGLQHVQQRQRIPQLVQGFLPLRQPRLQPLQHLAVRTHNVKQMKCRTAV